MARFKYLLGTAAAVLVAVSFWLGMLFEAGRDPSLKEKWAYREGLTDGRREVHFEYARDESLESRPQVLDALQRWAQKNHKAFYDPKDFSAHTMFIPTVNQADGQFCIELSANPPAPSGSPVYCYKNSSLELVAEYSDVE